MHWRELVWVGRAWYGMGHMVKSAVERHRMIQWGVAGCERGCIIDLVGKYIAFALQVQI